MTFGLGAKFFLATLLVVVLVLGTALVATRPFADRAADERLTSALQATQSSIEDALQGRGQSLARAAATLAQVPTYVVRITQDIRTGNRANLLDQADEFRDQLGARWVLLTDNVGVLLARTDRREQFGDEMGEGALIGLALQGQATGGTWIEATAEGDRIYQAVGVPIIEPGGRTPHGVLVAALPVDSAFVADLKRHTNSDMAFLALDTLGRPHITATTLSRETIAVAMSAMPSDAAWGGLERGTQVRWPIMGRTLVGIVGPLLLADGETAVGGYVGFRSRDEELAVFDRLQQTLLYAFGGGLLLAILSSMVLARQITRPVQQLVRATRQVGDGQYGGEIEVRSHDEIGQLAGAFRQMVQELRDKQSLIEYLGSAAGAHTVPVAEDPDDATVRIGAGTATRVAAAGGQMLEAGSVLDNRYEIRKVLGVGGMGVAYRAHDRELDEVVAIKTLKPDAVQADGSSLERFKQEIRLARRITHRNVVRTHDLGEVRGTYYITMEFVEGANLKDLVRKRGHLPAGVALTVGKQLCRALEAAHEQGVIHRDIKPANMVVDAAGFLKVMDFGIARLAAAKQQAGQGLTAAGVAIGTPEYMAPEQLMGEDVDVRADLYAAGAVLYECVTGRPVFAAPTVTALMLKHLEEEPQDPREIVPDVPASLSAVILKALAKKQERRWQTAAELHAALEGVRVETPPEARTSGSLAAPAGI